MQRRTRGRSALEYGRARARGGCRWRDAGVFGLRSRCRGSARADRATYRRVSVPDATTCPKRGLFQPSVNLSADHETGLAEPKLRQQRRKRTRGNSEPVVLRSRGTSFSRYFALAVLRSRGTSLSRYSVLAVPRPCGTSPLPHRALARASPSRGTPPRLAYPRRTSRASRPVTPATAYTRRARRSCAASPSPAASMASIVGTARSWRPCQSAICRSAPRTPGPAPSWPSSNASHALRSAPVAHEPVGR